MAMISLWTQIDGLIGSNGIAPAESFLERIHEQLGATAYRSYPTIFWFGAGHTMLHAMCAAGTLLSLLLILGVAPGFTLALFWATYLSLVVVGQSFLSFQWDILLLETTFMALFWASWQPWPRLRQTTWVPAAGRWLLWCLLFKLMFLSGVTKLLSGDRTWHEWTALEVHYETQPLPNFISWYTHQLPPGLQSWCLAAMFVIEIVVPLAIFAPRRIRHLGCGLLVLLQLLIAITGNYGFFNLLTVVLCLTLLDDQSLRYLSPKRWTAWLEPSAPKKPRSRFPSIAVSLPTVLLLYISTLTFFNEMVSTMKNQQRAVVAGADVMPLPKGVVSFLQGCNRYIEAHGRVRNEAGQSTDESIMFHYLRPFRTISGYGLFRNMTMTRPEFVIEGSHDRSIWREYEFRWKPGDLKSRPRFVAPHQPRLDWQMWFAALSFRQQAHWVIPFLEKLLEGSPPVLRLIDHNPFLDQPPDYIRLVYYQYRFSDWEHRAATGQWWQRSLVGRSQAFRLGDNGIAPQ